MKYANSLIESQFGNLQQKKISTKGEKKKVKSTSGSDDLQLSSEADFGKLSLVESTLPLISVAT